MPITKAKKGGYQWNGKGKVFPTRRALLSSGVMVTKKDA